MKYPQLQEGRAAAALICEIWRDTKKGPRDKERFFKPVHNNKH